MSCAHENRRWWAAARVSAHLGVLSEWFLLTPLMDAEAVAEELAGLVFRNGDPARVEGLIPQLAELLHIVESVMLEIAPVFEELRDSGFEAPQEPLQAVRKAQRALAQLRGSRPEGRVHPEPW